MPNSLTIFRAKTGLVLMEVSHPNDTASSLAFSEASVNNAMAEFVEFIVDSHMVYSQEESIQIVRELLE